MFLVLALAACQTPFGVDRHDFDGFRIAAISASGGDIGDPVHVSAAIVSDGHLWSHLPVELHWHWLAETYDLAEFDGTDPSLADAIGPSPDLTLPDHTRLLGLVAVGESTYRAVIEIPEVERRMPGVYIAGGPSRMQTRETTALTATFKGPPTVGAHARWMGTAGTFSELDAMTTDWKAPKNDGTATLLTLVLDDEGRTQWAATDLHVGNPGLGIWIGNRWIPSDVEIPPGSYDVEFAPDNLAPSGVRILSTGTPTDTEPACTAIVEGPFDPRWVADGRCSRQQLIGTPVSLVVQ